MADTSAVSSSRPLARQWVLFVALLIFSLAVVRSARRLYRTYRAPVPVAYNGTLSLSRTPNGDVRNVMDGGVRQTFEGLGEVIGILVLVRGVPDDARSRDYRFVMTDSRGQTLVEQTALVPSLGGDQVLEMNFLGVKTEDSLYTFYFERLHENSVPLQIYVAQQPSHIFAQRVAQDGPHPLTFEPKYGVTPWMRWHQTILDLSHMAFIAAAAVLYWVGRRSPIRGTTLAFGLLMSYDAVARYPFSFIDEESHFSHIDYLRRHHQTPYVEMEMPVEGRKAVQRSLGRVDMVSGYKTNFNEAVQGPLYYALCAVVLDASLALFGSWGVAYYCVRLFGVMLVTIGFYSVCRSVAFLAAKPRRLVRDDLWVQAAALGAVFLSPAVLSVLGTITNDQLAFCLGSVITLIFLRLACLPAKEAIDALPLGIACGLMWVTKLTGISLIAVCCLYLLTSKRYLQLAVTATCIALFAVPLHLHWWIHYGAPTGISQQLAIIHAQFPGGVPRTLWKTFIDSVDQYPRTFLYANAYPLLAWHVRVCWALTSGFLAAFFGASIWVFGRAVYIRTALRMAPSAQFWRSFLVLGTLMPFVMCFCTTYVHNVDVMVSRLSFPSLLCVVGLGCLFLQAVPHVLLRRFVAGTSITASLSVAVNFMATISPFM